VLTIRCHEHASDLKNRRALSGHIPSASAITAGPCPWADRLLPPPRRKMPGPRFAGDPQSTHVTTKAGLYRPHGNLCAALVEEKWSFEFEREWHRAQIFVDRASRPAGKSCRARRETGAPDADAITAEVLTIQGGDFDAGKRGVRLKREDREIAQGRPIAGVGVAAVELPSPVRKRGDDAFVLTRQPSLPIVGCNPSFRLR
jgi:hypothetical protein